MSYQFVRKNHLNIAGIVLLFLFISCTPEDKSNNLKPYSLEIGTQSFPIKIKKYDYGCPYPKYLVDAIDSIEYVFNMQPPTDSYLRRYKVEKGFLQIDDSVEVPNFCLNNTSNRFEDYYIKDKETCIMFPYDKVGCMDSFAFVLNFNGDLDTIPLYSGDKLNPIYVSFLYESYKQYCLTDSLLITNLNFSFIKENRERTLRYNYPNYRFYNYITQKETKLWKFPKYLQPLIKTDQYFETSTIIKNNYIINIPLENKFHIINLNNYKISEKSFENKFFRNLPNFETTNRLKRMFETDNYTRMLYNPFLDKLFLFQHVAEDYESEDGLTVRDYKTSKKRILVFDSELELEGNFDFGNKKETYYCWLYPSPNGFFAVEPQENNGDYILQEYILKLKK